jgi:hypothetical protein
MHGGRIPPKILHLVFSFHEHTKFFFKVGQLHEAEAM